MWPRHGVSDATGCDEADPADEDQRHSPAAHNSLKLADLGDAMRQDATGDDSSRGGTRTRTGVTPHWILSPERLPIPPLGQIKFGFLIVGLDTREHRLLFFLSIGNGDPVLVVITSKKMRRRGGQEKRLFFCVLCVSEGS